MVLLIELLQMDNQMTLYWINQSHESWPLLFFCSKHIFVTFDSIDNTASGTTPAYQTEGMYINLEDEITGL